MIDMRETDRPAKGQPYWQCGVFQYGLEDQPTLYGVRDLTSRGWFLESGKPWLSPDYKAAAVKANNLNRGVE